MLIQFQATHYLQALLILVLGRNQVWKKGECVYQCDTTCGEEFDWYKFEYITNLISSEVS